MCKTMSGFPATRGGYQMKGPIKRTFERAGQIPPPWSDPQDQRPWAWCRRCLGEIYAPTADGAALCRRCRREKRGGGG